MKKIMYVNHPYVYTDTQERFEFKELKGKPVVGAEIDENMNIVTSNVDPDCVGGVCPIK